MGIFFCEDDAIRNYDVFMLNQIYIHKMPPWLRKRWNFSWGDERAEALQNDIANHWGAFVPNIMRLKWYCVWCLWGSLCSLFESVLFLDSSCSLFSGLWRSTHNDKWFLPRMTEIYHKVFHHTKFFEQKNFFIKKLFEPRSNYAFLQAFVCVKIETPSVRLLCGNWTSFYDVYPQPFQLFTVYRKMHNWQFRETFEWKKSRTFTQWPSSGNHSQKLSYAIPTVE